MALRHGPPWVFVRTLNAAPPGPVPNLPYFFGTNFPFKHCWPLNRRWAAGWTDDIRDMNDKSGKKSKASNQQLVKEAVSSKLKAYYDDISRQEVPQRFLDLLADLDKASGGKSE